MSSQIQITGETKVKSLTGVLVGTSGVVSSLNIDGSLGIPQLDVNGKIIVSQLPNFVMEYKGTWDASTNTPTLVNGTGNQGDVYLCSVAGTVNFGAGAISFVVSDQVIYSGSIWQKASGTSGTVTSVAASITGNSLGITGSPITTAGTLAFAFAGTNLQYVNGAGDLTTFPTLITSIGLSMPSAFSVANSPLTANGTIAVTGAGVASQYIRGDGTLANFPTSGGGGSSVAYYFNSSVSQGTLGGVAYRELSKVPIIGAGTDITIATNGYIANYITDAGDPSLLEIPAGNWNFEMFFSASSGGGSPSFYVELYKYDGTTFTLISSSSATPEGITNGTAIDLYTTALAVPLTTLTLTDRLAIRVYVNNSGRTITLHTENSHLCEVITTFSTGIAALNGLTAQVQYFQTGTSGTDFAISSATATHTFNLPVASAANTGKLSSTDWSTFNGKVPYTGATANVDLGLNNLTANNVFGETSLNVKILASGSIFSSGYSTLSSLAGKFTIAQQPIAATLKAFTFDFSAWSTSFSNTYILPDASGTLALLESTQTFTGTNTFSGSIIADGSVLLKNNVTSFLAGYVNLGGIVTGYGFSVGLPNGGTPLINQLIFNSSAAYNYTFPAATGTLALTSNLSSYLPLAGGTMTGPLILSNVASGGYGIQINNSLGAGFVALRESDNSYTLGMTSPTTTTVTIHANNDPSYINTTGNFGLGTASPSYKLDVSGTGRFTGALTGTSATFSSSNTATAFIPSGATVPTNGMYLSAANTLDFATDSTKKLEITSGGNVGIGEFGSTNVRLFIKGGSTSGSDFAIISRNSGNAELFCVSNAGNVGICTISPTYKLDVTGTGRFTSTVATTGVVFPASQTASGDPNTLDDYEEGTWTAAFVPDTGSITMDNSFKEGRYTKVGRIVTIQLHARFTAISSPTGSLTVTGLPFTSASQNQNRTAGSIICFDTSAPLLTSVVVYVGNNTTNFAIAGFNQTLLSAASYVKSSSEIYIGISYIVD